MSQHGTAGNALAPALAKARPKTARPVTARQPPARNGVYVRMRCAPRRLMPYPPLGGMAGAHGELMMMPARSNSGTSWARVALAWCTAGSTRRRARRSR